MKEEYKTIPGVSNEAVSLILNAACNTVLVDSPGPRSKYQQGLYEGFVASLEAIITPEEIPAHCLLDGAIQIEETLSGHLWCVVVTTYGGHDSNTEVYGPYTLADAKAKSRDLEASGYDEQEVVRMEKGGITNETDDRTKVRGR